MTVSRSRPVHSGSIVITLNSSAGINANDAIRVSVGTVGPGVSMTDPAFVHSYHIGIATFDASSAIIDSGSAMIAVVDPVALVLPTDLLRPTVFNGLPQGEIAAGNQTIELSVQTSGSGDLSLCDVKRHVVLRDAGSFSPDVGTFFDTVLTGFQDGTTYTYYVRCNNYLDNPNIADYVISFFLDPTPSILPQVMARTSGSGSRVRLSRSGRGGNVPQWQCIPLPRQCDAFGMDDPHEHGLGRYGRHLITNAQANTDGSFSVLVSGLERGTYTFQAYATDSDRH